MSGNCAVRCLAACLAIPALACAQPAPLGAAAEAAAREPVRTVILSAPRAAPPGAGFCSVTMRCMAAERPETRAFPALAARPAPGWRTLRRGLALEPRASGRDWRAQARLKFRGSWFGLARPLAGGGRLEVGYHADGRMEVGLREQF